MFPSKRKLIFSAQRIIRKLKGKVTGKPELKLLIACHAYFHYLHILPVISKLSGDKKVNVTVLKVNDFEADQIKNVRYINKTELYSEVFKSYDLFLALEFTPAPWWFSGVNNIFMLHGVGPKVSYFTDKRLGNFDTIFSPGPYISKKQSAFLKHDAKVILAGLPITDSIDDGDLPVSNRFGFLNTDKPIILYAPSWSSDSEFISMDDKILNELINQKLCNVIIRPHPLLLKPEMCDGKDWKETLNKCESESDHIRIHSGEKTSIYDVINHTDILISDISSVLYEYLLRNRPIIIYMKEEIHAYYEAEDFQSLTIKACTELNDASLLSTVISESLLNPDTLSKERAILLNESLYNPGGATEIIVSEFNKMLFI